MAKTLKQLLQTERPEIVAQAKERAEDILLEIHLAELRQRMNMTQSEMAALLGVKQPTVSEMEKPGKDLKLSSLKKYAEASGCKLKLAFDLPDGTTYTFTV